MMCRDSPPGPRLRDREQRSKILGTKEVQETRSARIQDPADNDLEWGSVVGRELLQQCLCVYSPSRRPHCLLTSPPRE